MHFLDSLSAALASLRANKLRSILTVIGVIFGVGSVMVMMSFVEGARANLIEEFDAMGASTVFVIFAPEDRTPGKRGVFKGLTLEDVEAIRAGCDLVAAVSPERTFWDRVVRGKREHRGRISGVGAEINEIVNVELAKGRELTADDVRENRCVCVLGAAVAEELFGEEDPLGKEVRIRKVRLRVVGVLAEQGRIRGVDLDAHVQLPISVVLKRLVGGTMLSTIEAKALSPDRVDEAADQIWALLRRRHERVRDFIVDTPVTILRTVSRTLNLFSFVLGGVGSLALLVAGIGIMNIMLVSVTERTQEIGVRKAVGATQSAIKAQFLTEAGALSGCGGLVGIAFGYGLESLVSAILKDEMPLHVPLWATLVAFTVSVSTGVFFGWYPARKAAQLDPIEALRSE